MKEFKNFQELVQKVTMYLDNELSPEEEKVLLREIQSNPEYGNLLSKERSFREFIKSQVHRREVSPSLVQSIKEKIRLQTPTFAKETFK